MKCQALFVFTFVPASQVKVVKCSAEGWWQGQVLDDLHRAGWEDTADPVGLTQVPVLIQLPEQHDDVPFVEPQLAGIVPSVGVQCLGSWNLWDEKQPLELSCDNGVSHRQNSPKVLDNYWEKARGLRLKHAFTVINYPHPFLMSFSNEEAPKYLFQICI